MTYLQLLELIEAMSDEQQAMDVTISCEGGWYVVSAMTQLTFVKEPDEAGDEQYPVGQPILEC